LKRFREFSNGSVLWFDLVFCLWLFHGLFHFFPGRVLSVSNAAQAQEGCKSIPLGRLNGGCFPSLCWARKSHKVPVGFQELLFFSGALATAAAIFISLKKLEKQF
jgi:hypothetical protein